mmetsp:Transcript_6034/g.24450  ORF Transcript_6034/g.24450 Transcript_6034/m.24450 type:complete len:330 (+) Transcript_6034:1394-2383(+)
MFPMACFPIAHWYVFRGDWLWCGYGIMPAHTPRSVNGSISRCVCDVVISLSYSEMYELFSSLTSKYSTKPSFRKSANPRRPSLSSSKCVCVHRVFPFSTMSKGRQTLPPSDATYTRPSAVCTETNSPTLPCLLNTRTSRAKRAGCRCTPRTEPLRSTNALPGAWISPPVKYSSGSTPSACASERRGSSSSSVVTCVMSARFFTSPQLSPSGVSEGHSMPHWLGCSARGPETLRVFSNWLVMRVIIPSALMNESRDKTCVTPFRSILNRFTVQFPDEIACSNPLLNVSCRMHFRMSNCVARLLLLNTASAWRFKSALRRLKQSSNSRASN